MTAFALYAAAALAEIVGCFAFWLWAREGRPWPILLAGLAALALFAWLLTRVEAPAAGRAFAAYGGVYIVAALAWMGAVEGVKPDARDLGGAALCLLGAALILHGPR